MTEYNLFYKKKKKKQSKLLKKAWKVCVHFLLRLTDMHFSDIMLTFMTAQSQND